MCFILHCIYTKNHNNHCIINHTKVIETSNMTSTLTLSLATFHATSVSLLVYGCVQYHLSLVTSSSIDQSRMKCGLNKNDLMLSRLCIENNPITGRLCTLLLFITSWSIFHSINSGVKISTISGVKTTQKGWNRFCF